MTDVFDVRPAFQMRTVCEVLLRIAEKPLEYLDCLTKQAGYTEQIAASENAQNAAFLARQASASVVLNCAAALGSTTVWCLMVLEPTFPFAEDVAEFVKDSRLKWMSYVETAHKLCGRRFKGTAIYQKIKTIID